MANVARGSVAVLITASADESVAIAADGLAQRRIKPVVILIDPTSFGSSTGIETLAGVLKARKIPVAIVHKGDDLKWVLEKGFLI